MLDLVIDNQEISSRIIHKSLYSFKNCIKAAVPTSDYENLENYISNIMHREKQELLKRHHSKLKRDTDYAIYVAPSSRKKQKETITLFAFITQFYLVNIKINK